MRSPIALLAALAALALPPAHAAHAERDKGKDASAPAADSGNAKKEARAAPRTGDDLASCKRDADGMRGPDRSRFMTQCLRERK